MKPTILFRQSSDSQHEFEIAQKYFNVVKQRMACPHDSLIIGRYSVLPHYNELINDLKYLHCNLINSYDEHKWIANFEYYNVLKYCTPQTWELDNFYKCDYDGPFVVKGKTNSKKQNWNKMMYAESKKDVWKIVSDLNSDITISDQGIIVRKYVPLKLLEVGINGMPFTNEWRFFYYKQHRLSYGFYWDGLCDCPEKAEMTEEGLSKADEVAMICKDYTNFVVIDIAQTAQGDWIVIELNDGQCSGLSANKPDDLYSALASIF